MLNRSLFYVILASSMLFLIIILCVSSMAYSNNNPDLQLLSKENPFAYDLGLKIIPDKQADAQVTICCHGYGHSNEIVDVVNYYNVILDHLIGFNFPDYGITSEVDHAQSAFGSINEVLPLLYILKRCTVDLHMPVINLYGFSAGGGAIVNALAVLNQTTYDQDLQKIGITSEDKSKIVKALQGGLIVLECPLKSVEEIIELRGHSPEFQALAVQFSKNNMRPIDTIQALAGLSLHILLYFEQGDDILGNRDDQMFIDRLKAANGGTTEVVFGTDGGHNGWHKNLWQKYKAMRTF